MNKENWIDITGYEGCYQVSDIGRVRSLERIAWNGQNYHKLKGRVLKIGTYRNGYKNICLCIDGIAKRFLLHRIVGKHFIANPDNLPEINHRFGDKADNRAKSLEWSTRQANNLHAFRTGLREGTMKGVYGIDNPSSRAIFQYDLMGNLLKKWVSAAVIERTIKISRKCVGGVARGRRATAYGFIWKYE